MSNATDALEADAVVKTLGGARVLRGVTASFEAGTVHVIEGANGSGKSTLLSVLGGRSQPSVGRVTLRLGLRRLEARELRDEAGWLGHELGLYAELTPLENIALHARLRGLDPESEWKRMAAPLGIERTRARRTRELSRGQRQRVALARALVGEPRALLLDEPSTGLDSAGTARLVAVLRALAGERRVLVLVTHDAAFRDALGGVLWRLAAGVLTRVGERFT